MSTYKLIHLPNPNNKFDNTEVVHTVTIESLPELIEAFEYFLKGCGFHFDGTLEIVEDEPNKEG